MNPEDERVLGSALDDVLHAVEPVSGERLRRVESTTPDGILVLDESGVVLLANPQSLRLFAATQDDLIGQQFGAPIVVGNATEVDLRQSTRAGRVVELRATRTTWEDRLVTVVALHDISGYKDTQANLERELLDSRSDEADLRDALSRSEAAVADASHQRRNPLAVIAGMAYTLLRSWDDLGDDGKQQLVQRIAAHADRMDSTPLEAAHAQPVRGRDAGRKPEEVEMSAFVFERLTEFGPSTESIQVSCDVGITAMADPDHLWEILADYLENGMKYGDPPLRVTVTEAGETVDVAVCDRGRGVPPEFAGRLFDRFTRADAQTRTGTGLGLAIARELAAANDGSVWYEPADGGGSCFGVRIPAA